MAFTRTISCVLLVFIFAVFLHPLTVTAADILKNCTTSPCETCTPKNQPCRQTCSASSCDMNCAADKICHQDCTNAGGCNKMTCTTPLQGSVQSSVQSSCEMGQGTSPSSASEMECTSKTCNMKCAKDNCKMKCGVGNSAWCYAKCEGRGCTIDCNSEHCEISLCSKGYCTVNVGQGSDVSITSCAGGCCTLNCHESIPKNLCVIQPNACPNNTCIVNFGSTPTQLPSVCSASPKPATSAPATTPSAASGREYAKLVTFGGMIGGLLITALLLV